MTSNYMVIIRANIRSLMNLYNIDSFKELSKYTEISADTIRKWYKQKETQPRLSNLDKLCDKFQVHTSDLFIPNSSFSHYYEENNNSQKSFRKNFNVLCIQNSKLIKVDERINLLFDSDRNLYYSLISKNRIISIDRLDWLIEKMQPYIDQKITIYDLLK